MATTMNIGQAIKNALRLRETPQIFRSDKRARAAVKGGITYLLQMPTGVYATCQQDVTCDRLCVVADALLIAISYGGKWHEV